MPDVIYVTAAGDEHRIDVREGDTVMDGAVDHAIPGILGQCGGGCTCATCHCFVDPDWAARLPAARGDELDLLAYLPDRTPESRLSCQIRVTAAIAGLRVHLPAPWAPTVVPFPED